MHDLHQRPRRVLGDDCTECRHRARTGLDGLSHLDNGNLRKLAVLAAEMKVKPKATPEELGASHADLRAVETLRLAARIVHTSGITDAAAR